MIDRDMMRGYFAVMLASIPARQRAKRLERFEEVFSGASDLIRTRREKPVQALFECISAMKGISIPKSLIAVGKKKLSKEFDNLPLEECADDVLEVVRCAFDANAFIAIGNV